MPKGSTELTAFKAGIKARRTGRRHRARMTIPLAMVAGLAPTLLYAADALQTNAGGPKVAIARIGSRLTGYNAYTSTFSGAELMRGWGPLLMGALVHKAANAIGINRMLSRAKVPLLRV